jgi:hypothetical protein
MCQASLHRRYLNLEIQEQEMDQRKKMRAKTRKKKKKEMICFTAFNKSEKIYTCTR